MINSIVNIITINSQLEELGKQVNRFMDKFTDNGLLAGTVTLIIFVLLCLFINSNANK